MKTSSRRANQDATRVKTEGDGNPKARPSDTHRQREVRIEPWQDASGLLFGARAELRRCRGQERKGNRQELGDNKTQEEPIDIHIKCHQQYSRSESKEGVGVENTPSP